MLTLLAAMVLANGTGASAMLGADGSVRLTRGEKTLGSLAYGVHRAGWNFMGQMPGAGGKTTMRWDGGEVQVTNRISRLPTGFRLQVEATPGADLPIESAHLSLNLGREWTGASVMLDSERLVLPKEQGDVRLRSARATSFRLSMPSATISVQTQEPVEMLVQDSRRWGSGFEIRFYSGLTETWKAGQTRRYQIDVNLGALTEVLEAKPIKLTAGPDWVPFQHILDVEPGSALDFSPAKVTPAGAKGWITVTPGGRFAYASEPSKPLRFYGANLCFWATTPDHETSDRLAVRLRRMGHNTVRLHHYDVQLTGGFGQDREGSSTGLDPEAMDRFDYLFAKLKEQGIYVKIDLFTIRQIRRNEVLPGIVQMDDFKALQLVSEKARENWWAFSRNLLNHVNKYTGLAYKDDPALAWICPVNENNVGSAYRSASPETKRLFDQAWQAAGNTGAFSWETDAGARFGADLHLKAFRWMKERIRSTGSKALLTDNNGWHDQIALIRNRAALDWVDNHNYWDHPSFLGQNWGLPSRGANGGGIATASLGGGLQNMALTRLFGKPFTVSEFQFTAPNRFRAEGGLFMGALAARQDWDALWRFAWSHNEEALDKVVPFDYFNIQSDPAMMASERAIVPLYMRGDLPKATPQAIWKLDPMTAGAAGYNSPIMQAIMDVRVGTSATEGSPNPRVPRTEPGPVVVNTEEGILTVDTPRTVGLFGPVGRSISTGVLNARLTGHRAALWVTSRDGKPVKDSGRLLLVHVTDVQNNEIEFTGPDRDVVTAWGKVPHLVRNGGATVRLAATSVTKAFRLDAAGKRVAPVPVRRVGRGVELSLTVRGPNGATMYYELVR
jgi:hypothetical protein